MKSILGFTAPKEAEPQPICAKPAEPELPVRSLVKIKFSGINKELSYYNDKFLLKEGDVVFVSGKLWGQPGRVTEVTTKFCIHTKDYERVLSKLDLTLHGSFRAVKNQMVCFDAELPITPPRFKSWITPPIDPKQPKKDNPEPEDEVISGEGFVMDIHDLDGCEDLTKVIWERGLDYYAEGNVKYLCVKNGVGRAFVKGTQWYQVNFRVDENGLMTDVYCDCPYMGLCKHEAAVALSLLLLSKNTGYSPDSSFVALSRDVFWQLASLAEEITV